LNHSIGNSLAGTLPPWLVAVDTSPRLVVVVPSWELPHLAGVDFDALDCTIRFAHTIALENKDNVYQFVDRDTLELFVALVDSIVVATYFQ